MRFDLNINGRRQRAEVDGDTPLLWVLRDALGLTGTKFGCGAAQCGACTVHVDGEAVRSCVLPVQSVAKRAITTIEGLAPQRSHVLQQAWIAHQVPQCGYCQSGMLMAAAALLRQKPNPSDAEIDAAITNICRCGTYRACAPRSTPPPRPVPHERRADAAQLPALDPGGRGVDAGPEPGGRRHGGRAGRAGRRAPAISSRPSMKCPSWRTRRWSP
jgi:isoquinoline 1-oxidoreductase alpha subunit